MLHYDVSSMSDYGVIFTFYMLQYGVIFLIELQEQSSRE